MIRILQVVNNMHRAGLETMLMNYYRGINRDEIQFDFLTHRPQKSDYDDEIESMGGKIYHAPRLYPQNYIKYFKYMKEFFEQHTEYQIIHSHIDTMSYLPLLAAKRAGVPIRIAHSHTTSVDKDLKKPLKLYFKKKITSAANYYCSCGQAAGEFMFPNKEFKIIHNAVIADKFSYNEEIRKKVKEFLGLKDEFVIGHVGRLSYPKNHEFLIDVFSKVLLKHSNSILLIVGEGEKEKELKAKVRNMGLDNNVRFLGNRSNVNELYQVMDVFVMPSLFEGVPVVGIEAQFSGLPCIFSDRVPKEVGFMDSNIFLSLEESYDKWADIIVGYIGKSRQCLKDEQLKNKYNIDIAKKDLLLYYLDLLNKGIPVEKTR